MVEVRTTDTGTKVGKRRGCMYVCVDGRMVDWMDGWMDGWLIGWLDGWIS